MLVRAVIWFVVLWYLVPVVVSLLALATVFYFGAR